MNNIIEQMLSKYEIKNTNDEINALKEIIQEIVLAGLSRGGFFKEAAFYGGTALRIFYGLDRFSEDLDFALLKPDKNFDLSNYFEYIKKELHTYKLNLKVNTKIKSSDSNITSAFLKGNTLEHILKFFPNEENNKYNRILKDLKIKFEVDINPPAGASYEDKYKLLPNPHQIKLYDKESLFAGKIHAILCRNCGAGGYNGGGTGGLGLSGYASANGGGGATHIATKSGLLSSLENFKDSILIVSGGGGGFTSSCVAVGGSGGGAFSTAGNNNYLNSSNQNKVLAKATQTSGYAFGRGEDGHNSSGGNCGCEGSGGAGGGFYGGFTYQPLESNETNANVSGSGGSGYIGNFLLSEKAMYCYNCEESNEESTKTISTTCTSETPTENCAKKGNGYARITLVSVD